MPFSLKNPSCRIVFAVLAVIVTATALSVRVWDHRWLEHLQVDPGIYQSRAAFFLRDGSWSLMGNNEYQPGALWFFVLVGALGDLLSWLASTLGYQVQPRSHMFLSALISVNCALLLAHALFAARLGARQVALVAILALLSGPILLCRFELAVSFLVIAGWVLWDRGRYLSSALILGVATSVKIYPVLLLPLLLASSARASGARATSMIFLGWLTGLLAAPSAFIISGGTWSSVMSSVLFHAKKPIGVDGFAGSVVPLLQSVAGLPLRPDARNGVFGIHSDLPECATFVISWIWVPFVIAAGTLALRVLRRAGKLDPAYMFVILGLFVGLGKLMAPQYYWWAVSILPFCSPHIVPRPRILWVLAAVFASLYLSQLIYPLHYTELLECISGSFHLNCKIFWVNLGKNVLWLTAVVLAWRALMSLDSCSKLQSSA